MMKKNRIFYLDVLRVVACLSVIMIHSSGHYITKDVGSFNYWIGIIFDSFSRVAVPLFVMISGCLFLDSKYNYSNKKIKDSIKKMILFFIFWSSIYCLIFNIIINILNNSSIDIVKILGSLIIGHYHLWFIYLIIGLYLIVPLLRLWVNEENKHYVEYFLIISIFITFLIPQLISICCNYSNLFNYFDNIVNNYIQLKYVGGYTTYFILGWYINKYDFKYKKTIYIFGIVGLFITIFGSYFLSVSLNQNMQLFDDLSINILLFSVAVFLFVKNKLYHIKNHNNKIVDTISKNSLGIYGIHVFFVTLILNILDSYSLNYALIFIPFVFLLSFFLSLLCTILLSKIPGLKKFV